ncbi:uncharacterized protein CLUP02_01292 [Colletotrichum lupini]|uniref:Uncharacterized protein n=1 Tax=Colletotrichum lupini TaxID=145971 RepID=A0A9Q8SC15_9PEZI|nr:uncharacterized protein CLUP02_01292 [Colletotrichum lupini]UQC74641.1 hypothetical protein CLUP02_01292 [Colletotrichum lupini]
MTGPLFDGDTSHVVVTSSDVFEGILERYQDSHARGCPETEPPITGGGQ